MAGYFQVSQYDLEERAIRGGARMDTSSTRDDGLPKTARTVQTATTQTSSALIYAAFILALTACLISIAGVVTGPIGISKAETAINDASCCNTPTGGPVDTIIGGDGITVNSSDPHHPIVGISSNFTFNSTSGVVDSIVAGNFTAVDSTDPRNPIVSSTAVVTPLFTTVTVDVTAADLNNNATFTLFTAGGSNVYVAMAIYAVVADSVNFDSGGNCLIYVFSGVGSLSQLSYSDTSLKTISSYPDPLLAPNSASSGFFFFTVDPGGTIQAKYNNPCGTYVSGSIRLVLQLQSVSSSYLGAP